MSSCKKQDQHLPPDFNYKIPEVSISEDVHVGAYYYNQKSSTWSKVSDTSPLGEYTSIDVMAQERENADKAGVDFFVFNWNGVADDGLLQSFIDGRTENVKMVINFNTNHLKATNSSPLAGTKLTTMLDEFANLASSYFGKDFYYTVDGKPLVLITPINLPSNAAASIDYTTVVPALRDKMSSLGVDLFLTGEITSGWLPPQRYSDALQAMDAVTLSDWSTDVYDRAVMMAPFMDINWKNWTDSTSKWDVSFIPNIFPGFDDKVGSASSKKYNIDRTPQLYIDFTNVAKRNMGKERLVLINSWNNFKLATEIAPSVEYGDTYLELTRKQFKVQ
jgi:hypothetical protein